MCFTGNPGTGKTTVAMRIAEILHRLGYIKRNHVVAVTRDDLVGQYVGHTAPKTKEVLKRAYGGVLFIDEAYYLYRPENERDYGEEAIEILLQVMEDERDKLVVIFAGYKDRMDEFFRSNPGMGSRVAHHIDFPDYDVDELMAIAPADARATRTMSSARAPRTRFRAYLERRRRCGRASPTAAASATRSTAPGCGRPTGSSTEGGCSRATELMTIRPDDIMQSSVFAEDRRARGRRSGTRGTLRRPLGRSIILGVVGDSAAGKTTLTRGLVRVLGEDNVTHVCTDDYHRYDRRQRAERGITPLTPTATTSTSSPSTSRTCAAASRS